MGGKEMKVSTVSSSDSAPVHQNPLPSTVSHLAQAQQRPVAKKKKEGRAKKSDNSAKEKKKTREELKKSKPHFIYHQIKRTAISVIMSFLYTGVLVAGGLAIIVAQEITQSLPQYYYEGFFTFLYGVSIAFVLIMFCILLRECSCCRATKDEEKHKKETKGKKKGKQENNEPSLTSSRPRSTSASTSGGTQERLLGDSGADQDLEAGIVAAAETPKRKTTQNGHHHGSFFMRLGTIGFGLGTMIYVGLHLAQVTETMITDHHCYGILEAVNPGLQMIFTFMQMYFIFMNARLNIHRYKLIARFGLMHIVATNICVWIRTGVFECTKQLKRHYANSLVSGTFVENATTRTFMTLQKITKEYDDLVEKANFRRMRELEDMGGSNLTVADATSNESTTGSGVHFVRLVTNAATTMATYLENAFFATESPTVYNATTASTINMTAEPSASHTTQFPFFDPTTIISSTVEDVPAWGYNATNFAATEVEPSTSFLSQISTDLYNPIRSTLDSIINTTASAAISSTVLKAGPAFDAFNSDTITESDNRVDTGFSSHEYAEFGNVHQSAALQMERAYNTSVWNDSCIQMNVMKQIIEDSAPFLYPFAINFSIIGAAVVFIIWRHIGRLPRFMSEENIERKLEAMLSQRAVVLAKAQSGTRMDCVGASKGLFFGLLMLVGSIICLVLYFVLIMHTQLRSMAIYLADASHTFIMALSILAIFIGFIRAKNLKFYPTDTSELNDLLLVFSAIGVFIYSLFSIIAGASNAMDYEKHFFVMVTGIVTIIQVVLQYLFISDMSKRHVFLPEHDRSKPGRQIVTFLIICNFTMWMLYAFESRKVMANPVQLDFYGFVPWTVLEHVTLPLCMFHRFYAGIALAEIWKNSYKPRLE